MQSHVSTPEAGRYHIGVDRAGQKACTSGKDLFQITLSFRSGVFREDLIKGQRLTLGLEGLGRIEIRGEEWGGGGGGETAPNRREKGHMQRQGGRNKVA